MQFPQESVPSQICHLGSRWQSGSSVSTARGGRSRPSLSSELCSCDCPTASSWLGVDKIWVEVRLQGVTCPGGSRGRPKSTFHTCSEKSGARHRFPTTGASFQVFSKQKRRGRDLLATDSNVGTKSTIEINARPASLLNPSNAEVRIRLPHQSQFLHVEVTALWQMKVTTHT